MQYTYIVYYIYTYIAYIYIYMLREEVNKLHSPFIVVA